MVSRFWLSFLHSSDAAFNYPLELVSVTRGGLAAAGAASVNGAVARTGKPARHLSVSSAFSRLPFLRFHRMHSWERIGNGKKCFDTCCEAVAAGRFVGEFSMAGIPCSFHRLLPSGLWT